MNGDQALKILFVINPNSGRSSGENKVDLIRNYLDSIQISADFLLLTGNNDENAIRDQIVSSKPERVIAVGGDGTVTLVAKQLLGKNMALGIVPAGSANGMAKELGIPETTEAALEIAVNGQIRDSDVIRINNEHICLHLSDIGLNAQLVKHFEEGKVRGKLGYAMVVIKTLWRKTRLEVAIKSGNKEQKHDAVMVVIANATKYGTGAIINPEGSLYDGLFEVVIVKKLDALFKMLLIQRPFNPQKIEVFHATSLIIKTRKKVHFQVDGEYIGRVNRIEGEIMPGQLKLIVP